MAHHGEPGQGQLPLGRPERQAEDHDEQAEHGRLGQGERDDERGAVRQRGAGQRGEHAERKVIVLPGMTRLTTADSWPSSIAEPLARTMLGAGWPAGPGRASCGMTTNVPPPGCAGVLASTPATRTEKGPTGSSEVSWVGRAQQRRRRPARRAPAPRAGGQRAARGAERGRREGRERGGGGHGRVAGRIHGQHRHRLAERRDPGRAPHRGGVRDAADRRDRLSSAGVTGPTCGPVWIDTSAPVACQDAAVSPRVMPVLTIPAKVARLSASTSANAGSTPVSEDRAALDRATKPVAPVPRADSREQAPDGQRVQPQHDQHHRDGHQHRRRGQQQVDPAAGRDALAAQHDQAGHAGRARRHLGHRAAPAPRPAPPGLGAW